ncbi:oxidoreductase [Youhaiella tibetensis]|uniref:Thioredoxin reductase n=1 Tax=Paradevosia tibetensis TaxID=1447062 RepID=A0A5B9DRY8_9HYPH|nr:NAD(P)/FAD-dependent oxidoreductase [Youhaiella tibetensis]QEE21923.1 NAD(P)/FAD-dependent oxidoreductase [Youhaiella tibetensis]GGF47023.1 oxidoreductase [Youhaiella tibetensis]
MVHDAIVIGGSFAGLSAATYIARARRSVAIIDAGAPRNRFASHSHGFFSRDGSSPLDMLAIAREQVDAYPSTHLIAGKAATARRDGDIFAVALESGETVSSRYLVLAYGVSDELPKLPGLAERWGQSVIICPYCHGFEFSGRQIGVLYASDMSSHQAMLVSEWGPTTYYLNGADLPDAATLAELEKRGIAIERTPVAGLEGEGTGLSGIRLADGRTLPLNVLYIGPRNRLNSDIAQQLGCEIEDGMFGSVVKTNEMKQTSVPGVFAAGDITRSAHNVTWATSDGVMAGTGVHRALVF